jgi:hypothetical protein
MYISCGGMWWWNPRLTPCAMLSSSSSKAKAFFKWFAVMVDGRCWDFPGRFYRSDPSFPLTYDSFSTIDPLLTRNMSTPRTCPFPPSESTQLYFQRMTHRSPKLNISSISRWAWGDSLKKSCQKWVIASFPE